MNEPMRTVHAIVDIERELLSATHAEHEPGYAIKGHLQARGRMQSETVMRKAKQTHGAWQRGIQRKEWWSQNGS